MAFPLTPEQRDIVQDRGGELLVSAAAGSGKTRVLVERLLDRVTEEGLDIDRFLVITYTKAAAAELRTRVAQELAVRLAERPHDRHLQRQLTLVYKAQISTIHAFCAALLRESGHLLDLDPDFRLCDEGEAQVLMARTLEEVLDRAQAALVRDLDRAYICRSGDTHYRIPIANILYFVSDRRQVACVTAGREYTFYGKLDTVAAEVGADFVRIHQRYLVRTGAVDRMEGGEVVLRDGRRLPVSRSCQPSALLAFTRAELEG